MRKMASGFVMTVDMSSDINLQYTDAGLSTSTKSETAKTSLWYSDIAKTLS